MTSVTDICNRALQAIGTRTDVTDAELAAGSTNEAKQFNLIYANARDDLSRMAPWNCCFDTMNLVYITSSPGTPENTSAATTLWQKGQPAPPWAYEYQYPVDCLRACFVIPANQTTQGAGIPITTAVTGGAASFWQGAPVRFRISIDQFYPVTAATKVAGGSGYAVGDLITLAQAPQGTAPLGAPVVLQVATLSGSAVATVTVVNQIAGSATPLGGSYFAKQTAVQAQGSTTGAGVGATFALTQGAKGDQRVILTNQQYATLSYCKQVTDPNVFDTLFQSALIQVLSANLVVALTGDKQLANMMIGLANNDITEARKGDGNEGLTINDVTPDWIRIRGINWTEYYTGPYSGFDFGGLWPMY
jgi:hypothetical protein